MNSKSIIHNGFKLKSLDIKEHPILGNNTFNFIDESDSSKSIYFTVLIGSNGTGKSELFRCLLELFRGVYQIKDRNFSVQYFFTLEFYNSGYLFKFGNQNEINFIDLNAKNLHSKYPKPKLYLWNHKKNEDDVLATEEFIKLLPTNIIANSLMLTDKFIAPRNGKEKEDFPIYKYLGVRSRPQQASTRGYVRKTVEFIVEQINSDVFKEGINNLSKFLGYDGSIMVQYKTAYTTKFFKGDLTIDQLDSFFNEIEEKYKKSDVVPPFKLNHFNSLKKQSGYIERIVYFMNSLHNNNRFTPIYRSSANHINYLIDNDLDHKLLKEEYAFIDELRKLGFVSAPNINLIKGEQALGVQETSSGEFHFFSTMVGLMATVKPGSLIFIDEPEISLHPNWQMKYLEFVRKLFSSEKYNTCHIIIATHSHFLISDLKGESAKIIGLKKEKNEIKTIDINANTFGWSAEQVLLDIFEVSTTRNYVVAERIGELLDFISKEKSTEEEIKQKYFELGLNKLDSLPNSDPLKTVLNTIIEEYVQ
ncbi:MAG: AAA family ATPase [Crocinitomicaceae bacterium]|nr:AAA family ATPase [Crocinitomicaceae bacterium]